MSSGSDIMFCKQVYSGYITKMKSESFDCVILEPGEVGANGRLEIIHELASEDMEEAQIYFYHPDHLGSSSFITDASGDAHQHLQYLPFGEDTSLTSTLPGHMTKLPGLIQK